MIQRREDENGTENYTTENGSPFVAQFHLTSGSMIEVELLRLSKGRLYEGSLAMSWENVPGRPALAHLYLDQVAAITVEEKAL